MKPIAISPGDPAGIGPEVCLKALSKNIKNLNNFILIGDIEHFRSLNNYLKLDLNFDLERKTANTVKVFQIPLSERVKLGMPSLKNAKYT